MRAGDSQVVGFPLNTGRHLYTCMLLQMTTQMYNHRVLCSAEKGRA